MWQKHVGGKEKLIIWFSWPNVESTVVWFALLQILSCFDPDGGYRWFCFLILAWCSSWWRKELPLCVNTAYLVRWCCHEWMQLAKFWLCITKKLYTSFINFFRHYVCVFIFVKIYAFTHFFWETLPGVSLIELFLSWLLPYLSLLYASMKAQVTNTCWPLNFGWSCESV